MSVPAEAKLGNKVQDVLHAVSIACMFVLNVSISVVSSFRELFMLDRAVSTPVKFPSV